MRRLPKTLRHLLVVFSGNAIFQGISFLSTILVIRYLPVEQYALYGIALNLLGVLNALADSGVSQSTMTHGGPVKDDPEKLGEVVSACQRVLIVNGIIAIAITIPVWFWIALKHTHDWLQISLIGLSLVAAFAASLGANIYRNVILLHGQVTANQFWDSAASGVRLVTLIPSLFASATATSALLCASTGDILRLWAMRRRSKAYYRKTLRPSATALRQVYSFVFRTLPVSVYNAFSSQILFFAMAVVAGTSTIASAGALSRFHQLFLFVPMFAFSVLAPRLASCSDADTRRIFLRSSGLGISLSIGIAMVLLLFPHWLLIPLGPSYSSHENDLRLVAVASLLQSISSVLNALVLAKGWIIPPQLLIPCNLGSLALGLLLFDLSQLHGYLSMNAAVKVVNVVVFVSWSLYCLRFKIPAGQEASS